MESKPLDTLTRAQAIFHAHGGILRSQQARRLGIHPATLYAMKNAGLIRQISRGVYRLANLEEPGYPDFIATAARVPNGVICLLSALEYHGLTTQVPHEIYLAISARSRPAKIDYPPIRFFRFSAAAYQAGIETHRMDGLGVKIYSPEKTIADCFKFRNKLGLDTTVEALRLYRERKKFNPEALLHFASVCRVENVLRPYLEAVV